MGLGSTVEHLSFLTKLGISLEQLRIATRRLLARAPYFRGRGLGEAGEILKTREGTLGGPLSAFPGRIPAGLRGRIKEVAEDFHEAAATFSHGTPPRGIYGNPRGALRTVRQMNEEAARGFAEMEKMRKESPGILAMFESSAGGPFRPPAKLPALQRPIDREAVHRAMLLHEGAELGKHPGIFGTMTGHLSLRPPLTDLNLALSLPKELGEAKDFILGMRQPEILGMKNALGLKRLPLGEERLSRHAIRRIQELQDQAMIRGAQGVGIDVSFAAQRRPQLLQRLQKDMLQKAIGT